MMLVILSSCLLDSSRISYLHGGADMHPLEVMTAAEHPVAHLRARSGLCVL